MPTQNRRVATYLPKEIDDRLKTFIKERELKGESQALIVILSEFFGVSQQVAQSVDYSSFATADQFNELSSQVSRLVQSIENSSSLAETLGRLQEKINQLEARLASVETVANANKDSTLSTSELAKRLKMDSSTLSHWKSGKKGKSPDELLRASREKDPDGIGWILIPELNRFKPEKELPSEHSDLQGSLLGESDDELIDF